MPIIHHIVYHVHRHKEKIVAHIKKHHKKYIFGAGIFSGMAMYKAIGIMVIFFGIAKMGGVTGSDYLDTEFYTAQAMKNINISNIIYTGDVSITGDITDTTGCNITGNTLSGTTGNCPLPNK